MKKRLIALLLAIVMVFALCGFTYQHKGTEDSLVYTALGDSASNGYGMEEYGSRTYIYGQVVDAAYPAMFAEAIGATTFNQDCLSGLRSEDLLYLLDPEGYAGDAYTHDTAFGDYVMSSIRNDGIMSVERLSDLYIQHVTEADVITLNIGLNNFGNFLTTQINHFLGTYDGPPYDLKLDIAALDFLDSEAVQQLREALLPMLSNIEITEGITADKAVELVESLLQWFAYTYVDNYKCFDAIIERIYELNPDCELYVLGMYDVLSELYLTEDSINIGKLVTHMMKSINTHIKYFAPHCNEYIYVDIMDTENFGLPKSITDPEFLDKFTADNGKAVHPSYAGHQYIFEQLMAKYNVPFKDVAADAWYYDGVRYCYVNDIMQGTSDVKFSPNQIVTRAQMATILYRMAGSPDVSGLEEPFLDVSDSHWAHDAIVWAYNEGVVKGFANFLFAPGLYVSRGQMVTMLYRYAGSPEVSGELSFKDAAFIPKAYRDAILWASENGIVNGYENGNFNSALDLNRAQMAVIISRYCTEY